MNDIMLTGTVPGFTSSTANGRDRPDPHVAEHDPPSLGNCGRSWRTSPQDRGISPRAGLESTARVLEAM
jgi:hypothetical protein